MCDVCIIKKFFFFSLPLIQFAKNIFLFIWACNYAYNASLDQRPPRWSCYPFRKTEGNHFICIIGGLANKKKKKGIENEIYDYYSTTEIKCFVSFADRCASIVFIINSWIMELSEQYRWMIYDRIIVFKESAKNQEMSVLLFYGHWSINKDQPVANGCSIIIYEGRVQLSYILRSRWTFKMEFIFTLSKKKIIYTYNNMEDVSVWVAIPIRDLRSAASVPFLTV